MACRYDTGFAVLGSVLTQMIITICIAMLVIGFIDKKYQDYEYNKSLKMTKQEVKDEWKNTEGDP
ncbi:MAG: EscU/YscU/HrcU family type III secretion system export apparatus switch protein, partial [Lachnospiraceae bacterium]|nr:EscU/YscU/HrcU family type III secretion system export apparatus switch protein [Lachnospiraceae bacterium]